MAINDPMLDPDFKFSINKFPGNGVTVEWQLNLSGGYIRREHVKAYKQDLLGNVTEVTLAWVGPNQVLVTPAVATGSTLTVYRDTPKDTPLVDFTDGAIINEQNLDLTAKQAVFIAAEMVDRFSEIAASNDLASEQALAASEDATQALAAAGAATLVAANANSLATDTAVQFQALLQTVQDLSGADLSGLARLNVPQSFTESQSFPTVILRGAAGELEYTGDRTYRIRPAGGVWGNYIALNDWSTLANKPGTYPPSAHSHSWGDIAGKPLTFAPEAHTHAWGDITGKPTAFTPEYHTHTWSSIADRPAVAVLNQPANFSSLTIAGTRVVAITTSTATPSGGQDGDLWIVVP